MKRKAFIKTGSAALAAMVLPAYVLGRPFGYTAPSDKINLACCGIGNRGADVARSLHKTGLANVVAICDVDMGAPHTQEIMQLFPTAKRFKDFRELFDKMGKEFDAVSVGVPDFSHFPIAMLAMNQGKHVYVEKPMAHTFREVELMMQAEKKYKVSCQMGNQGHSEEGYFQFKAWTEAGIIKDVTAITAFMNNHRRWHGLSVSGYLPAQPVPETLDWDCWLGTAAFKEYNRGYVNGDWRSWYEFGNGALGDWGAHIIDNAHQFLELGLPTEVNPVKMEGHSLFLFPQASTLVFKFAPRRNMPACELTWYDGYDNRPELPAGFGDYVRAKNIPPPTAGAVETKRYPGKIIYAKELTFKGGSHAAPLEIFPAAKAAEMAPRLPVVPQSPSNHFANFLKACKGEETCRSSFEVAGPLCQVMALGVLAQRLNTKLVFDPRQKKITNSRAGNELLAGPPPRKGWEQFYKM
ncbi:Gfo/Idh/MocA family oxidoreductase [Niabella aurantiaca]|uniref:Gfo/Idh/MocA family oxidoreductase n=1 Tax=Niabella aurantiaca TaxID=379900 RepID=UPI000366F502|nr:Gfo/Idh/MocA family oxidoreductase [Niabella aurantiaca]